MSRRSLLPRFLAMLLVLSATTSVRALVYDAYTDFDPVNNPTTGGIWRYGFSPSYGGALTLYPNHTTDGNGNQIWIDNAHQSLGAPLVFRNNTATAHANVPASALGFHPGPVGSGFDVSNVL